MSAPGWKMRRVLDPTERFSEILFGLIMVLTFTGTLSITGEADQEVREMLIGALGCNLAWGIADGVMYVITAFATRARGIVLGNRIRKSADPVAAHAILADVLPEQLAAVLTEDELESIRRRVVTFPEAAVQPRVRWVDLLGAVAVCLFVFLSTFPVVIPFMIFDDVRFALRCSNGVALLMLFLLGHSLGSYTGGRPWRLGLGMLLLGAVLVSVIIALGG